MNNKLESSDCLEFSKRMETESVDLICTDPPYGNVVSAKWDKGDPFTPELCSEFFRILKSNGNAYVWCSIGEKSQSLIYVFNRMTSAGFTFKDAITWKKQRGRGNRRGWLYVREECLWFVKSDQYTWNKSAQFSTEMYDPAWIKRLGREEQPYKRSTNVWTDIREETLSGACGIKGSEKKEFSHVCPKPEQAIARIVLAHTNPGDVVFDCFVGSGTTAAVCAQNDRLFCCCDIDSECIEETISRLSRLNVTRIIDPAPHELPPVALPAPPEKDKRR